MEGSEVRVLLGAPRGLICCRGLPRGVVARGVVAGVGECEGGGNMEEPFFFERKRRNMLDATTLSARMSVVAWLVASIWGGVGGNGRVQHSGRVILIYIFEILFSRARGKKVLASKKGAKMSII